MQRQDMEVEMKGMIPHVHTHSATNPYSGKRRTVSDSDKSHDRLSITNEDILLMLRKMEDDIRLIRSHLQQADVVRLRREMGERVCE